MGRARQDSDPEIERIPRDLKCAVRQVLLKFIADKDVTQVELAYRSDVSRTTLRQLLTSRDEVGYSPKLDTIAYIAAALGIPLSTFFAAITRELRLRESGRTAVPTSKPFKAQAGSFLIEGQITDLRGAEE